MKKTDLVYEELVNENKFLKKENESLKNELSTKNNIIESVDNDLLFVNNLKENAAEERRFWFNVLDKIPIVIYIAKNQKIVKINSCCEEVMGYTPEECYGFESLEGVFHPDDWKVFIQRAIEEQEDLIAGKRITTGEYRLKHKDGSMRWIDYTRAIFEVEEEAGIFYTIGTATDITVRKLAQKALSESEEKFRRIIETANEGIVILDNEDKITFINGRIVEMFGYQPDEMLGKTFQDFKFGSDKILERAKASEEKKNQRKDQRFRRNDGSELWVIISSTPVLNQQSKIDGSFAMLNDITERKQAEVQLIRYAEELLKSKELLEENSKELALLNKQLLESEKKLKDLNDTKDKFFSLIAHDLKNPFGILLHFSKVLSENYNDYSDEEKQKFLAEIYHSTDQSYKLLENLLEWSRSQTGKLKFEPQEIDLSPIAFNSIYLFKNICENKEINIISHIFANTIVFADYNMINTVFRNLISNAVKFTKERGNISISSQKLDGFIEVTVSDDGIGMDSDTLNKLFQLDSKTLKVGTNGEKGTGLGLILCKEFVERNGGEINVESVSGKGTSFKFKLPMPS
jgi:PAS domain S-box-containing protein